MVFLTTDAQAADYFCKFKAQSAECIQLGESSPAFSCTLNVTDGLIDILNQWNYRSINIPNPGVFRTNLEQFRDQLEKVLRTQAEKIREKDPSGDLSLYRQIITLYSQGISLYKDGISIYRQGISL
jgi:hypothetical protein